MTDEDSVIIIESSSDKESGDEDNGKSQLRENMDSHMKSDSDTEVICIIKIFNGKCSPREYFTKEIRNMHRRT